MSADPVAQSELDGIARNAPLTRPRPGHADLAGVQKFDHDDVRNVLERASARHTAVFVAAGVECVVKDRVQMICQLLAANEDEHSTECGARRAEYEVWSTEYGVRSSEGGVDVFQLLASHGNPYSIFSALNSVIRTLHSVLRTLPSVICTLYSVLVIVADRGWGGSLLSPYLDNRSTDQLIPGP